MRIAVITTSYPARTGDACGHFVQAEARALAREAEVVVIAPSPRGAREGFAGDAEPTVRWLSGGDAFGWPGVAARLRQRPTRGFSLLAWVRRARRELASLGPFDRLVAHWALPCAWPIADGSHGELEVVSHGADVRLLTALPRSLRSIVVGRIVRRSTSWRFVSAPLLENLQRELEPSDARALTRVARVAPCAIELPDVSIEAAKRRAELGGGALYVCVARLVPSKCVDRAIAYVASRPRPRTLVVVGDGPERTRLSRLAKEYGLDTRFVGQTSRPEALAWIAAADALVHASRAEGRSTVVREAEALGTRVVRGV